MIQDGVEMIVGVANDDVFGPVVMLGIGGIFAETLRDVTYRVAPFDEGEGGKMIRELRTHPILFGARGRRPSDTKALAALLAKISRFAWEHRARVVELDINPLMVRPEGQGVVAADALVVLR
jgi:acyl-CoA synthetase (NDP forming)